MAGAAALALLLASWAQSDEEPSCSDDCSEAEERCLQTCGGDEDLAPCEYLCQQQMQDCLEKCE